MREFNIYYIETCYPDYLQDHHHRDGECLLSLCLASQSEEQAALEIVGEVSECDTGLPADVTDEQILAAARVAVQGLTFHPYDAEGNEVQKPAQMADMGTRASRKWHAAMDAWENEVADCESRAYFVASWGEDEDE